MPKLRIREVRLPELRLPEMTKDDIVRTLGDARRDIDLTRLDPRRLDFEVDLHKVDPRRVDLTKVELPRVDLSKVELPHVDLPRVDLPRVDLSRVDLPKPVRQAAVAAGLMKPPRRSRTPFVVGGLITLALVAFAVMTSPILRPRLDAVLRRFRGEGVDREAGPDEPRAYDAAIAVPIEPAAYSGSLDPATSPYDGPSPLPEGFGADVADLPPSNGSTGQTHAGVSGTGETDAGTMSTGSAEDDPSRH